MSEIVAPPPLIPAPEDQPPKKTVLADATMASLGAGATGVKVRWLATEVGVVAVAVLATTFILDQIQEWDARRLVIHLGLVGLAVPLWAVVLARGRLYQARFISTRLQEWRRLFHAAGIATLVMLAFGSLFVADYSRWWVLGGSVAVVFALMVEREVVRRLFTKARRSGRLLRDVLIVGANHEGNELRTVIEAAPELGYRFVGFAAIEDEIPADRVDPGIVTRLDEVTEFVERSGVDNVILVGSALEPTLVKSLTRALVNLGVHVELSPVLPDTSIERVTLHQVGPHPLVYLEHAVQSGTSAAAKRVFDVAFSAAVLLLGMPLLALTAVAIKLDSRGPVFFRQVRLGHHGRRFAVLKFRSMTTDAEQLKAELESRNGSSGPLFKMAGDPRVTRVGGFLRRSGIDEIPQFWNVLRGDMSVVGPRPALPSEAEEWPPELHHRLRARPGITGMWQIMGEDRHDFDQYVKLDLYYVDNWSLFDDLSIVVRTIPSLLARSGD